MLHGHNGRWYVLTVVLCCVFRLFQFSRGEPVTIQRGTQVGPSASLSRNGRDAKRAPVALV